MAACTDRPGVATTMVQSVQAAGGELAGLAALTASTRAVTSVPNDLYRSRPPMEPTVGIKLSRSDLSTCHLNLNLTV
jgi:hypothetical protein